MNTPLAILSACLLLVCPSQAEEPESQPQVEFQKGSGGFWDVDFDGSENRTFFIQWSENLSGWSYAMTMDFGESPMTHHIYTDSAPKFFVRLVYEDYDWVGSLEFAEIADFDGDGIPNLYEIETLGTDPLDKSSDGGDSNSNGIPDGYELYHFGTLGSSALGDDPDGDGLANQIEVLLGMNADADFEEGTSDKWEIFLPE